MALDPEGPRARKESRYPITQAGLVNLSKRIVEMCERDSQYGECEVKVFPDAKINGRSCLCIQVTHPTPRRDSASTSAVSTSTTSWASPPGTRPTVGPPRPASEPPLQEEYTFLDLKLDNGFTDADFDVANPAYGFPRQLRRIGVARQDTWT